MDDKLAWVIAGKTFKDGSRFSDWETIYQSPNWHWQYDKYGNPYGTKNVS